MARVLQLRTPKELEFGEVVWEMSDEAWKEIKEFVKPIGVNHFSKRGFYERIYQTLERCSKTYDRCGKERLCSDEIEGSPWLDYDDNITILSVDKDSSILAYDLALAAVESVVRILKPGSVGTLFGRLQKIFERKLNSHVYFNPVCRNSEFCQHSTAIDARR